MISSLRALPLIALLLAGSAQAFSEGAGRISVLPGWRYTPNDFFAGSAQKGGFSLEQPSPGGPQLTATFGYMATHELEIAIDLFGGFESLALENFGKVTSTTYGALLLLRAVFDAGPLHPFVGGGLGPVFSYTTGGDSRENSEKLSTGYVVNAGLSLDLDERLALTLDARWMLARGQVQDVGGINAGGLWTGIGVTWVLPGEPSRPGAVR